MKIASKYRVSLGWVEVTLGAWSVGHAARLAFRKLIANKAIKRQPKTDRETGGWVGVSIERVAA